MSEIPKMPADKVLSSREEKKEFGATFSQKLMDQAYALADEILSQPEITELRLPISEKGSLLLTLTNQGGTVLEEFEFKGKTFYIVLLNSADNTDL